MITATTRLLDALRASHDNCTDYRAGKLLGVSTSAVSRWRLGQGHMSMANVSHACELAGVAADTWEWQIRIGAEREKGPDGDIYREALKDLESFRSNGEPSPHGLFALLRNSSRAAAILAGVLTLGLVPLLSGKPASAAALEGAPAAQVLHIMANRLRRLRRRWLRFLFVFPAHPVGALA